MSSRASVFQNRIVPDALTEAAVGETPPLRSIGGRVTVRRVVLKDVRISYPGADKIIAAAFHQNVAVSPDYLIGSPEISGLLGTGRMNRDTSPA